MGKKVESHVFITKSQIILCQSHFSKHTTLKSQPTVDLNTTKIHVKEKEKNPECVRSRFSWYYNSYLIKYLISLIPNSKGDKLYVRMILVREHILVQTLLYGVQTHTAPLTVEGGLSTNKCHIKCHVERLLRVKSG